MISGQPPPPQAGATILSVPGLDNSGPDHWQTLWEQARPAMARVELGDWSHPNRDRWVARLDAAVRAAPGPVVLCAHSLGCLTVAWWATGAPAAAANLVAGALLVAPPDCDSGGPEGRIGCFAPVPRARLPFPTVLVASRNDRYAPQDWSRALARAWGSAFVDAGWQGHINADSRLGPWPQGASLLDRLIAKTCPANRTPPARPRPLSRATK